MNNSKHGFRTVILVFIFAAAVVGGVFGISYYKGGVTFPWQVSSKTEAPVEAAAEPAKEAPKLKIKESAKQETPKKAEKPVVEKKEEEPKSKEQEQEVTDVTGEKLEYYGALSVEDGKLVNSDGDAVQLVGVSTHGLSWFPEFVSADSIKTLRDEWGVNTIRLAMYTSDYNGYCVGGADNQTALKDKIDEVVKAATEDEMYVIIDWHILNDNDPNEYKSEAIQFFGEMVRKYKSNDNIIYEICNEPNGDTSWDDIKIYATEVIPVIRNIDKDAIILVGTPKWSSDLESVMESPLEYDNIMYTYHFYAGSHGVTQRNQLTDALDEQLPVFISEYGFVNADGNGSVDKKEAAKWLDVISEYQVSSCIWNLSNKDEGSALISADSKSTADWTYDELSAQGQYFFDILKDGRFIKNDN